MADKERLHDLTFDRCKPKEGRCDSDYMAYTVERNKRNDGQYHERRGRSDIGDEIEYTRESPPQDGVWHAKELHREARCQRKPHIYERYARIVAADLAAHDIDDF